MKYVQHTVSREYVSLHACSPAIACSHVPIFCPSPKFSPLGVNGDCQFNGQKGSRNHSARNSIPMQNILLGRISVQYIGLNFVACEQGLIKCNWKLFEECVQRLFEMEVSYLALPKLHLACSGVRDVQVPWSRCKRVHLPSLHRQTLWFQSRLYLSTHDTNRDILGG